MRSRPGGAPTSSRKGRAGGGAKYAGRLGSGGGVEQRRAVAHGARDGVRDRHAVPALRRRARRGVRPRVGFRPKSPQHEAGMRIDPPPSLACAMGTMPGSDRSRRAAAGPARRARGIPRVARRSEQLRFGRGRKAEFRRVGLAEDHQPGAPVARDQRRVVCRAIPGQKAAPRRHQRPLAIGVEILQQERHARQGSVRQPRADRASGFVVQRHHHRVESVIHSRRSRDGLVEQLRRPDLAPPHEIRQRERVERAVVCGGHGAVAFSKSGRASTRRIPADELAGKFSSHAAPRPRAVDSETGPVRRQSDSFVAITAVLSQISQNTISIGLGGPVVNW